MPTIYPKPDAGKILFRQHRGSFDSSMASVVEVKDLTSLREHILETNGDWINRDGKLTVEKYGRKIDERIGWDTHIVLWDGFVLGFTSGEIT